MIKPSWRGLMEAQRTNLKQIAALRPDGALGRAVQIGLTEAHKYVVFITHVWTGALRSSHRMQYLPSGNLSRGQIFIDPDAPGFEWKNNRRVYVPNKERPAQYGPKEHERGGDHAFYARTETEAGARISSLIERTLQGGL